MALALAWNGGGRGRRRRHAVGSPERWGVLYRRHVVECGCADLGMQARVQRGLDRRRVWYRADGRVVDVDGSVVRRSGQEIWDVGSFSCAMQRGSLAATTPAAAPHHGPIGPAPINTGAQQRDLRGLL